MNFKLTLVVLALIGQVDAAWKATDQVFVSDTLGTINSMPESKYTTKQKTLGFVNRIKMCADTYSAQIQFDLANICSPTETLQLSAKVGAIGGYYSSANCKEKKIASGKQDECISAIYFWSQFRYWNIVKGMTYYTSSGDSELIGTTGTAGKWLLPSNSSATVAQTQSCLTSFQVSTFLDDITNAGVYYNEAIPTYNSDICVSDRKTNVGGIVGGALCCVVCVAGCCFLASKGQKNNGETNAETELAEVVEETPQQITTTVMMQQPQPMMMQQPQPMMMQQPQPMMMQQPAMMIPQMQQPGMEMQEQPGMVAQPVMMM